MQCYYSEQTDSIDNYSMAKMMVNEEVIDRLLKTFMELIETL